MTTFVRFHVKMFVINMEKMTKAILYCNFSIIAQCPLN